MEPESKLKGDDIADRLLKFAVRVTRLVAALPSNAVGEACYWLRIVSQADLVKANRVGALLGEGVELTAILGGCIRTAKRRS